MEEMDKRYEFIGKLAVAMHSIGSKMNFLTLNRMLKDNGYKTYRSSRGIASAARAAHNAWQKIGDKSSKHTSSAIANTYVDKNGTRIGIKFKLKMK